MVACVVVGGGIVGALTARALARSGMETVILDIERPGAATPAAAGILFSIFDPTGDGIWASLARHGHVAYPELCAGVEAETGFERRGLLVVGMEARRAASWAESQGLTSEIMTPDECRRRYPQLAPPDRDVALLPEVGQVDPRRFMATLRRDLDGAGARWENARVLRVLLDGDRTLALGVGGEEKEWRAQRVVIAAGAWSAELESEAGTKSPVRPRRGQIVSWRSVDAGDLPIILDGHRYLVARANGETLAGATDEDAGFDASVTERARAELTDFARHWCPDLLAAEPDEHRAGLRPAGDASGPRVGAHERIRGLFLNTGHYRYGIVCAPGAAARLAKVALRSETAVMKREAPLLSIGRPVASARPAARSP